MASEDQRVGRAEVGGQQVAWASVGSGPPLMVGGWWSSHLAVDWRNARFRRFVNGLGEKHRVIRYDRPGTGLSGPADQPPATVDAEAAVLLGLADALGLDTFAVFGASSGAAVAAACAAGAQGRVSSLVLYGGYAAGTRIGSEEAREAMLEVVRQHWGIGSRVLADVFMPGATAAERAEFAQLQRAFGTSDEAAEQLRLVYQLDCRPLLPLLAEVPTLVLHRRGDRAIPVELGEDLADRIPNAHFVSQPGVDHLPWIGDAAAVVEATLDHLAGRPVRRGEEARSALTGREVEVLRLVATGLTDREIAEQLVLSAHTVHRHISNIRTKLNVPTRAAAAAWAAQHTEI